MPSTRAKVGKSAGHSLTTSTSRVQLPHRPIQAQQVAGDLFLVVGPLWVAEVKLVRLGSQVGTAEEAGIGLGAVGQDAAAQVEQVAR